MTVPHYTTEDLKKLPMRAIVAWAARCARRVEHLAHLPEEHPEYARCRAAIGDALRLAEDFARGAPTASPESIIREVEACQAIARGELVRDSAMAAIVQAAHAAAAALRALGLRDEPGESRLVSAAPPPNPFPHLADVSDDLAAREADTAAEEAADAVGHAANFLNGAAADYEELIRLDLGSYPQAGQPIDPSPKGPLGPLWPDEPPR